MALGNKTVKELPSISSGTPSGLQNTDLLYALRPGTVDSDYRVSGSDIDTFVAAKGFVRNTMTINGYTLAAPINLTYADVGAVANTTTVNGHALTGAVVISKGDVGLGNVLNTSTANTLAGYDNAGAFGDVTLSGGLTLVAGVLSGSGGTVTAVSIVSAHGFSGSSSGGATPALTINCTITGLLKADGTSISAATAGTDYVAPATTVNGHALSANVTVSASDLTTGTLPAGQLPAFTGGDVTSSVGTVNLSIGAGKVTNTMLAGSITAAKLVGSDIATVGTITAGTWNATTIAVNKGGTGLTAGTSGGILAYTATGTLASSALLAANAVVVGGGAGAVPASTPMTVDPSTGAAAGFAATFNNQTGTTYTLLTSDAGKTVTFNNAGAITVTLPNNLPIGFTCECIQLGAGQVTFSVAGGGALQNRSSFTKIAGQYGACRLVVNSNAGGSAAVYNLAGDCA